MDSPRKAVGPVNHLPNAAYQMPATWYGTMTTKQLRETLLATDGRVLACGELCDVVGKSLGAGVYRVTLRKAVFRG